MDKIRLTILILIIAVAASITGYFIYKDVRSTEVVVDKIGEGDNKISEVDRQTPKIKEENATPSPKPTIPPPDLTRKVVITASLPEETKKQALDKIAEFIKALKDDPSLFSYWIDLGSYMKLIGDYDGAVVYWKYAAAIRSNSFLPLANLGDLYLHNIKDVPKAEQNYLAALAVGQDQIMVYEKLSELYRYFLKDDAKAKAILQAGIDKNPTASERLKYILDNYENN